MRGEITYLSVCCLFVGTQNVFDAMSRKEKSMGSEDVSQNQESTGTVYCICGLIKGWGYVLLVECNDSFDVLYPQKTNRRAELLSR